MLVAEGVGDQIVFPFSRIGCVIILYVLSSVSLVFPQSVDVTTFRVFLGGGDCVLRFACETKDFCTFCYWECRVAKVQVECSTLF